MNTISQQTEPTLGLLPFWQASDVTELSDACSLPPSTICRLVYERTGNSALATLSDTLATTGLRIALILLIAWLVRRILRRHSR